MILYFTGTGNSEYAAKKLAAALGEKTMPLMERIRHNDTSPLESETPWIVCTPTYAWQLPHIVRDHLRRTLLRGSKEIYFVMTCGGEIGEAGKYAAGLCAEKYLTFRGCARVIMPENYIVMFDVPDEAKARGIVAAADPMLDRLAELIRERKPFPQPKVSAADKLKSGVVNKAFYPLLVHAKQFTVNEKCTDCGLCVSACRSGCIAPSPEQVQRDISPADSDGDTIWIGCEKSTRKNTVVRTCVSAYSWEALAYLALNKKIVLDLTPCGECENDVCAEHLRAVLTRLVEFFGQPLFEARFTLAYELDDAPFHVKEYSRREMMEQVTSGSKKGTKQLLRMLPGLRSEDESSQDFRLLLHQYTKQLKAVSETPLRYGYHLPNFTQKCFACGRCEKSCRSGAIKFEDLPDGQTRAVITPWKCSECGVCVAACSNGGLDGLKLRQLTSLGPVSVYKCTKTLCKECGKPIAPNCADGICSVCRIKLRTKKRQEEAVARAKERQAEREAKKAAEAAAKELAAELQPSQPAQSAAAPEAGAAPAPTESTC